MDVLKDFKERAAADLKTIVFAEGYDERIIKAAAAITSEKIAKIVVLGEREKIYDFARKKGVYLDGVIIIDPQSSDYIEEFRDEFYELRKHKKITKEEAEEAVKDPLYFGTMMIYTDKSDGMVAGAANATGNVLRPA
ncbi:MAG: phosphate acyltransferase, partial [Halanaerobium sp.]